MSLRARLAVIFVAAAILPLLIAAVAFYAHTAGQLRARAESGLVAVRAAAIDIVDASASQAIGLATQLQASDTSELAEALASRDAAAAGQWLRDALQAHAHYEADVVLLSSADGGVLAVKSSLSSFAPGIEALPPQPEVIAAAARRNEALAGVLLHTREVRVPDAPTQVAGYVVVGLWTDHQLLDRLPLRDRREGAAVVSGGRILAARKSDGQLPSGPLPMNGSVLEVASQGQPVLVTTAAFPGAHPSALLLWTTLDTHEAVLGWLLFAGSALLVGLLGWWLGGSFAAPIRRALAESERSRDELRQSLSRLGQTLSSSLDLGRTLSVVVETAMDALAADRAVLMLLTPERDALFAKVGRGVGTVVPRLRIGQGVMGWVAATGLPLRLPADAQPLRGSRGGPSSRGSGGGCRSREFRGGPSSRGLGGGCLSRGSKAGPLGVPMPSVGEPIGAHQLLVPLLGHGQVIGVLSLLRDDKARPFLQADLNTMTTFAAQASVAIENVLLHREAQRLAVTDPLTGLWNFRYFQVQADREVESAMRFDRPLSLVIVDLDHFKKVNDGLGHQVGDEVLSEVARRIRDSTRVPDVVARYGGEEFVVLLPGAGEAGAAATAERIRCAVNSVPVTIRMGGESGARLPVTCSAGVSSFPVHGQTLAGLLRAADAAMYVAKTQGRNRVVVANSILPSEMPWLGASEAVSD
jgi:diguanylate cyclase (GGDEF)-like protein